MKFANTFSNISIAAILAASATLSPAQTPAGTPSTPPPGSINLTAKVIAATKSSVSIDLNHDQIINVYETIQPAEETRQGHFEWRDGKGYLLGSAKSVLETSHDLPEEYDVTWEFSSTSTAVNLLLSSPKGKRFEWMVKGWSHVLCGMREIGGKEANDNPTTVRFPMESNRRYKCEVRIRKDRFVALIDDKEILNYATDWNDIEIVHPWHDIELRPRSLGIWLNKHHTKIYKLEVREAPDPVDLKTGLLAHYPYTGNANDHSGNDNHLEITGATATEDRFGMPNSAYAFDGQDDFMFADIDERKGDFSLSLWAKADDVEQSRYRSVINVFDKTPGSKDTCQIHTSGGRYPTYQFFSSNPESFALVTTEWQHLAVTVSGKVIRFYENGNRVYSQELEGGEANKFSNIIIGRNRHGGAKYHGTIDDVYVYERAINDAEVERLFNGGFEDTDGDGLTDDYEIGYRIENGESKSIRYKVITDKKYTFREAEVDAKQRGGHLATIVSEEEHKAVMNAFGGKLPHRVWIGGSDENTEGAWEWVTGELWKFAKWDNGQPESKKFNGAEDFSKMYVSGVWHDWRNQERNEYYLLEYGYYTDPTLADSDGDRVNDGVEVAAKTDPNNPLSRPAPDRDAPGAPPPPPPGPDYVKKIEELTKDNTAKAVRIEELEATEKAHLATIADLNATNASLTATVETQKETIAKLNAENAGLKQQLSNSREEVVNVSYELSETKEQLQAAIDVARTPFVNGWIYDPEQGWLFTDADHYPLVYSHSTESWHYYELGTAAPRFFYSYKTQEWEAWDPMPEQTETAVASSQSETTDQNL